MGEPSRPAGAKSGQLSSFDEAKPVLGLSAHLFRLPRLSISYCCFGARAAVASDWHCNPRGRGAGTGWSTGFGSDAQMDGWNVVRSLVLCKFGVIMATGAISHQRTGGLAEPVSMHCDIK